MKLDRFLPTAEPPGTPYEKDLDKYLEKIFAQLGSLLNQGLNFADNFDCYVTTVTTSATPGTPTDITHGLKRSPVGCLVLEKDKAAHIYKTSKSSTLYSVASDIASVTATLIIL